MGVPTQSTLAEIRFGISVLRFTFGQGHLAVCPTLARR